MEKTSGACRRSEMLLDDTEGKAAFKLSLGQSESERQSETVTTAPEITVMLLYVITVLIASCSF